MFDYFDKLYESTDFMPHGDCLIWDPILLWEHAGSDIITGISYYLIAAALFYFISKRRDIPYLWVFFLFGAFILSCGTTHFFAAWTIYYPSYWTEGNIKVINAAISFSTAIILIPLMPKLLALPSLKSALDKVASLNENLKQKVASLKDEITKRKETEDALRQSEAFKLKMVANIGDVIVIIDQEGVNRYKSPNIEKWFGWKAEDIIGFGALENVHPEDRETVSNFVGSLMGKTNATDTIEYRSLCKDGTYKWIEFIGTNLLHDPDINGILGNYRNITDRKQSEEKFQTIVQSTVGKTGQGFFDNVCAQLCNVFSSEYVIVGELMDATTVNAIAMILDGELIKNYSYQLTNTPCDQAMISGFCHYPEDITLIFPDDKDLQDMGAVGYVGSRLENHQGDTIGVLCVLSRNKMTLFEGAEDLMKIIASRTSSELERMKEEREKDKLENRLQQAQKMEAIGTLAGGIAHDFNNILGAIIGYSEMAKDGLPEESQSANDIKKVLTAGHRAKDLVKQILAFSRQAEQEIIPLKVQYLAKEVLKLLKSTIPTTIQLHQAISSTCGAVLADPTQIHQIIMNLCTNASYSMRENGGVLKIVLETVEVKQSEINERKLRYPGEYVRLEVSDTGHGMSRSVIERIFDPFFTTKVLGEGTGLGLAVVHGIVKSYNGFIDVSSELGQGTTFSIYLPQIDNFIEPQAVLATKLPEGKENILIVDDEKDLAQMMERMLTSLGYSVKIFTNSLDAFENFKSMPNKYDLVVTDMTMPRMTGATLSQKIIALKPDARIILCTGYSNIIDEEGARSIGISGYLSKPVIKEEIAKLAREVLDKKS